MSAITEIKITKSQVKKLAENLRILLKEHGLSENDLAQKLNNPVMTIRRLVSGETIDPRISTLKLIADYFKVTVDYLIEDNERKATTLMSKNMPQFVPVLDWVTLSKISSIKDLNLATWKKWQPITLPTQLSISDFAFALESRPSMQPRFPIGSIFVIEPQISSSDGDIVLVKIKGTNELTLRELNIDPPEWHLIPVVPGSNILSYLPQEHDIVGIVVLTLLYNRRVID